MIVHLVRGVEKDDAVAGKNSDPFWNISRLKSDHSADAATKWTEDNPAERLIDALRTFEWSERKDAKMSNPARTIKPIDEPVSFCKRVGKMSGQLAKTFARLAKMQAR